MPTIALKIDSCSECPFLKTEKVYTGDSFEDIQKWKCKKARDKVITSCHEWSDKLPAIPSWCPILITA
jgi:hypothetical protein